MKLIVHLSKEELKKLSNGEEVEVKLCRQNYENLGAIIIRKEMSENNKHI